MTSSFTGKSCRQLVAEHANVDREERDAVERAKRTRARRNIEQAERDALAV